MKKAKVNLKKENGLLSLRDIGYAVEDKLKQMKYLGTTTFDGSRHMVFQLGNTYFRETKIERGREQIGICLSEIKIA